jgi:hypothetical protein
MPSNSMKLIVKETSLKSSCYSNFITGNRRQSSKSPKRQGIMAKFSYIPAVICALGKPYVILDADYRLCWLRNCT